jgi:hypothetical protein
MVAADIAWCIKILMSFFIIHNNEKTLSDTALIYLSSNFVLDGVSTFPSLYYWTSENPYTISSSLRLLNFAQLMGPFSVVLKWSPCMRSYTQHRFNQIFFFISLFFFMLVLAHMCACFWIYIGRLDADLP